MTGILILLAHCFGDYVIQNDWMATQKVKRWWPAVVHAVTYTACYLPLTLSPTALLVIGGTHAVLDRYRLVRHLIWFKNQLGPRAGRCRPSATGFGPDVPEWLAFGLMVVVDNTIHLAINVFATMYL